MVNCFVLFVSGSYSPLSVDDTLLKEYLSNSDFDPRPFVYNLIFDKRPSIFGDTFSGYPILKWSKMPFHGSDYVLISTSQPGPTYWCSEEIITLMQKYKFEPKA